MTSTYTANNGLEKPEAGDQEGTWGGTLNTNFDIIDRVLSGVGSVSLSGTTHTLTTTDGTLTDGMYRVLLFTGALGANNTVTISPNDQDKLYFIVNNTTDSGSSGPYSVIIKQGTGATVTVENGRADIVYADGAGSGAAVVSLGTEIGQRAFDLYTYTATAGQTTFTGSDTASKTLAYSAGNLFVTLNGVTLENGTDYTATNGTSVVLTDAATVDDELNIYAFNTFSVANVTTASADFAIGDDLSFTSDGAVVNFGADSDVSLTHVHDSGLTLSAGANHTQFEITSTEDGANAGPRLSLKRDSANPADDDTLGIIYFKGENDADEEINYARIFAQAVDVSDGTEDGKLYLQVYRAGSQTTAIAIDDEVDITGALTATGTIFANGGMLKSQGTGTTSGSALITSDSGGTYCTRVLNSGSLITGTKASSPVNHTTSAAANVFVSGSGYIRKSTSSLRYKKDVQDLDPSWADKVLDFKPIFFKSDCPKVEGDSHEPDEWTYYGFAAEQVGTIDPRYVFWNREKVEWSDEGRKSTSLIDSDNPHGQAEGVQYDRITVALVDIIKRQRAAIDSLTKRVEALEAK